MNGGSPLQFLQRRRVPRGSQRAPRGVKQHGDVDVITVERVLKRGTLPAIQDVDVRVTAVHQIIDGEQLPLDGGERYGFCEDLTDNAEDKRRSQYQCAVSVRSIRSQYQFPVS